MPKIITGTPRDHVEEKVGTRGLEANVRQGRKS